MSPLSTVVKLILLAATVAALVILGYGYLSDLAEREGGVSYKSEAKLKTETGLRLRKKTW
jgi:hypothetical protein